VLNTNPRHFGSLIEQRTGAKSRNLSFGRAPKRDLPTPSAEFTLSEAEGLKVNSAEGARPRCPCRCQGRLSLKMTMRIFRELPNGDRNRPVVDAPLCGT